MEPNIIALMVRDSQGGKDGWYWGSWDPQATEASQLDWPPPANLPYPWMGFGYYCVNCHASAKDEFTFSTLNNVLGDPDTFIKFYFQDQPPILGLRAASRSSRPWRRSPPTSGSSRSRISQSKIESSGPVWNKVPWPNPAVNRVSQPLTDYSPEFLKTFGARIIVPPGPQEITGLYMPPEIYDHVFSGADGPPQFLTSDQCVGCHAAGSTGLHFDMTLQQAGQPAFTNLLNLAPYGEWRGSPMGLAGRDPIFFSQLETEQTVHPALAKLVPDLCLHCHGVMGQRQFCLDQFKDDPKKANAVCNNTDLLGLDQNSQPIVPRQLFSREQVKAIPFQATTEQQKQDAKYGGLARDGVSCTTCHHIEIDEKAPIGNTFTGDFKVGAADVIHGPFEGPQQVPMDHSLGAKPVEYPLVRSSKVCGSCHSVVLPVFDGDKPWVRPGKAGTKKPEIIIEQATYPEWVFSDFRDGGPTPQSCQNCHMATSYPGLPETLSTKIASIQEASNMPQTENRQPQSEIDLKTRSPFGRHTLVGLNVFFNQFAQQFPDILGIRIQDPMLGGRGVAPLTTTFNSMIQQADAGTARVSVTRVRDGEGPAGGGGAGGEPGRPQVPLGRGLPPRVPDVRGAGRQRRRPLGLRPDDSHGRAGRPRRQADRRRVHVEERVPADDGGGADVPAALPDRHPPGSGADLPGADPGPSRQAHHELPVAGRRGERQPPAPARLDPHAWSWRGARGWGAPSSPPRPWCGGCCPTCRTATAARSTIPGTSRSRRAAWEGAATRSPTPSRWPISRARRRACG